jgi:hypothetical protein
MSSKKQEAIKVLADRNWWRETAAVIGCTVYGFTYRDAATFNTPDISLLEVPGWLAIKIRTLGGLKND